MSGQGSKVNVSLLIHGSGQHGPMSGPVSGPASRSGLMTGREVRHVTPSAPVQLPGPPAAFTNHHAAPQALYFTKSATSGVKAKVPPKPGLVRCLRSRHL